MNSAAAVNRTAGGRRSSRRRFSLIEIMVVMLIIGLLAALVAPAAINKVEKAKRKTTKAQIALLANAVKDFYLDTSQYPRSLEDLVNRSGEKWDGPYLDPPQVPKDPWGNPYQYEPPSGNRGLDISSSGGGKKEIRYTKLADEDE
jgi:general secretion pathway protein G